MKKTMRVLSVLFALVLCVGVMAACGGNTTAPETTNTPTTLPVAETTEGTEASVPFVAPPDQIGLVVSADSQLVTWQPYATEGDVIDFKTVSLKGLGMPGEMSLFYMESEVTYFTLVNGKLEAATVYDVVAGSVIGITTLEEGVQEVYILSVPSENDGVEDEDPLEEIVEETIPPTTESLDYDTPPDEEDVG